MGYTTDFVGHIDIAPALNDDEIAYLTAFSRSRRFDRGDGPYAVPGNPDVEEWPRVDVARYSTPPDGQPGLWCHWVPCWDGCCLSFDGLEKCYAPTQWLVYLIDHLLKPDAIAATSGHPQVAGLTFDHRLDGVVVGCRRDNRELFAITVRDNQVEESILRPADRRYLGFPPLPYEEQIDRERASSRRRRGRRGTTTADVVDLGQRRTPSS